MKKRLSKIFSAVALGTFLGGGGGCFLPVGRDQVPAPASGAIPGHQELGDLVAQACHDVDIVLLGDTDHTQNSIFRAFSDEPTIKAFKTCGVTKVFLELPVSYQKAIDRFHSDPNAREKFIADYISDGDVHNRPSLDFRERAEIEAMAIEMLISEGIEVVAADDGNGAKEAVLMSLVLATANRMILDALDPEDRAYLIMIERTQTKEGFSFPEDKAHIAARIEELEKRPDIAEKLNRADLLAREAIEKRTDDSRLFQRIKENMRDGDKAVVMYGVNHMRLPEPLGIDALLGADFKTRRVDVFADGDAVFYQVGDDKPDFAYLARDRMALRFPTPGGNR